LAITSSISVLLKPFCNTMTIFSSACSAIYLRKSYSVECPRYSRRTIVFRCDWTHSMGLMLRQILGLMLPVVGLQVSSSDCKLRHCTIELYAVVIMQQQSDTVYRLWCKWQMNGEDDRRFYLDIEGLDVSESIWGR
jgi:hypothetical protein